MHPLEVYCLRQAGRGQYETGIGPIYSTPPFLQRGHGMGFFRQFISLGYTRLLELSQAFRTREFCSGCKILSDMPILTATLFRNVFSLRLVHSPRSQFGIL